MSVINSFILPIAGVFYDLYMFIVLPGLTPLSSIIANGYVTFDYVNIFTGLSHSFRLPTAIDDIITWLNNLSFNFILDSYGDVNLFAFLVLCIGATFFLICGLRLISMAIK